MIEIGKYHELSILRDTTVGLFLGDETGEEVLLPSKYCPETFKLQDTIRVFVYSDNDGEKLATTSTPKLVLGDFGLLKVKAVADGVGAFLDWGIERDLMVPFNEQLYKMEEGYSYIVHLDLDVESGRLYASSRIEDCLQNEILNVAEGDEVELLVWKKTDLGFSVIVNGIHSGLIFDNEIFRELNIGEKLKGYVKKIREDQKIDISLHPIGYAKFNDSNMDAIYLALKENNGFITVSDKSAPDVIYSRFGMSKKAFKKALGALYKQRKIEILPEGIKLI
ncbi:MAG: GntR family transcriptional regulator [Bacteroidales bacterium]|nr:GntR family transcriptional regulator [Bacteroidales bacterium]